jgi:hypothetical protein
MVIKEAPKATHSNHHLSPSSKLISSQQRKSLKIDAVK